MECLQRGSRATRVRRVRPFFEPSCLLIGLCLFTQAQTVPRLYPVDDTARDPAFRSYVGRLRSAVEARNTNALRKLVDEEVVVGSADDDKGWTKFIARWRPDDRRDSTLWAALADLLSLGFIREHPSLFLSPYLVWRFPPELSMATHLVVIRDKATLREAPSRSRRPQPPCLSTSCGDSARRKAVKNWFNGFTCARSAASTAI